MGMKWRAGLRQRGEVTCPSQDAPGPRPHCRADAPAGRSRAHAGAIAAARSPSPRPVCDAAACLPPPLMPDASAAPRGKVPWWKTTSHAVTFPFQITLMEGTW